MLTLKLLSRAFNSLVFSIIIGLFVCQAQSVKTQISGRVVDQNRAAVAGAKVIIAAGNNSASLTKITDENGEFSFTLESAEYDLTVSAAGFSEFSKTFSVRQGSSDLPEIVLTIAASGASVDVSAAGDYQIETINSATKTNTPLRDVPQAITVITKEQFKEQMFQSLGDAFRYTPGVSVHQGENNRDQVIIRGQNSSADFFLNGVRDDVQYYRDPYNIEQLEVLKGPNAMIFGRGGGGGVVNRVTKEAVFSPIREISLTGGSFYNRRVSTDFDQPLSSKAAFRLNGVYENSDSFRRFVSLRRFAFNPTFTFLPDSKTKITFSYEYARDRRVADRGITSFQGKPADVPISTYYGNPNDSFVKSNVNIFSGTVERQIGKLNVHNRTTFGDYERMYQNYVPGAVNAAETLVALSAYNNATKRKNLFSQTDLTYSVSTGRIRHTLLGGIELGRQLTNNFRNTGYFSNTSTSINVPYSNPVTNTPVTFRQSPTDANNHLKTNLAAAYVQDQIELSRYVQLIGGLRFDRFDLKYHNNRNGDNLRRTDNLVSPRVGIVVKPTTEVSIYGSYGVSYLPSSGDQFSSLTTITEQVKPEKFSNYEIGVKWDVRRNLQFTSALYRLDRTNTRSIDPNNPTAIIQTGSQRTNGFEAGLTGNILPKWSVSGGYTLQNAFITSATASAVAGKQVGQVPRNTFSLWNKYRFTTKFGAGLGIVSRSKMFAAVDNTVTLPGYIEADAAIFYTFNEHWRLQANVENLLNKKYILNADSNTNISPGSPRGVRVGLIAGF